MSSEALRKAINMELIDYGLVLVGIDQTTGFRSLETLDGRRTGKGVSEAVLLKLEERDGIEIASETIVAAILSIERKKKIR